MLSILILLVVFLLGSILLWQLFKAVLPLIFKVVAVFMILGALIVLLGLLVREKRVPDKVRITHNSDSSALVNLK